VPIRFEPSRLLEAGGIRVERQGERRACAEHEHAQRRQQAQGNVRAPGGPRVMS